MYPQYEIAPIHYKKLRKSIYAHCKIRPHYSDDYKEAVSKQNIFLTQKKLYTSVYINIHMALSSVYI